MLATESEREEASGNTNTRETEKLTVSVKDWNGYIKVSRCLYLYFLLNGIELMIELFHEKRTLTVQYKSVTTNEKKALWLTIIQYSNRQ